MNTTKFVKNGNFYWGNLNLNDIRDIITNDDFNTSIIDIPEYADVHVCLYQNAVITIYKYTLITNKCKLYNV